MAASEINDDIDNELETTGETANEETSETTEPGSIDADIDAEVLGLDAFDSPAPAQNETQPKNEQPSDKNVSRTGGRAPVQDIELPSEEEIGGLDAELGSGPAKVIRQLNESMRALSGLMAHRELLEQIGNLKTALPDIARAGVREGRTYAKQINAAFDEIAKAGGAKWVGENLSDRRANYETKYKASIDRIINEAARIQDKLEAQGKDVSIDAVIRRVWQSKYAKLGGKPAAKGEEAPAKKPPAAAVKEQARRSTPGINRTPSTASQRVQSASNAKAVAESRIAEFLKSMNN